MNPNLTMLASGLMSLGLVGCGPSVTGGDITPGPNDPETGPLPGDTGPCTRMDLVFVIDDSGSMGEEQENLRDNFASFAALLQDYRNPEGEAVDFRIAVTTTGRDINFFVDPNPPFPIPGLPPQPLMPMNEDGDNGAFRKKCGMSQRWIDGNAANMSDTLECLAEVGTNGPSIEMPLMMSTWALQERVADGTNAGFLRDDALLGIVMLTDENDCSRTDNGFTLGGDDGECGEDAQLQTVPQTIAKLDEVKQGRGRWAAAVIAGLSDCSSDFGNAVEATRLKDFAAEAGDNVITHSICDGSLTEALEAALDTFTEACEVFPGPS
ncbi:MAG: hypothetical protein IPL79_15725 [Myxococcales bacterium]|nr:hypothetical protein [Myxococcales bacterium]